MSQQRLLGTADGSGLWQLQCLRSVYAVVGLNRGTVRCSWCLMWRFWWDRQFYVGSVAMGGDYDKYCYCCVCRSSSATILCRQPTELVALVMRQRFSGNRLATLRRMQL
jgi:hypothetical protein